MRSGGVLAWRPFPHMFPSIPSPERCEFAFSGSRSWCCGARSITLRCPPRPAHTLGISPPTKLMSASPRGGNTVRFKPGTSHRRCRVQVSGEMSVSKGTCRTGLLRYATQAINCAALNSDECSQSADLSAASSLSTTSAQLASSRISLAGRFATGGQRLLVKDRRT